MSFKNYIKEQEELEIAEIENTKQERVAEFIRTIEDLNDEAFHDFAVNDLGMDEDEAEVIVYKMLRDFLLKHDENENGIPDGIEDLKGDELEGGELEGGEEVPAEDEVPDEEEDGPTIDAIDIA